MARNLFKITVDNAAQISEDLRQIAEQFPSVVMDAVKAQEAVAIKAIQDNWISIAGGTSSDFVYQSIGSSAHYGANNADVVGTVGVYNVGKVNTAMGKTESDLNAPQIAYWVEFGTSRLKSGTRKKAGSTYDPEELVEVRAKPFISNAFYGTLDAQQQAFIDTFNEGIDKVTS